MAEELSTDASIRNLIVGDLNLKEAQFEITRESSSLDGSAVCIVHKSWLKAAQQGNDLPAEVSQLSPGHLHWLMQPSCSDDRVPAGWYLVRLFCINKERISSSNDGRMLSAWRKKWSTDEFSSFLSQLACQNQQLSWRQFINKTSSSQDTFVKQKTLNEVYVHDLVKQLYGRNIIKIGSNVHGDGEESFHLQYSSSCPPNLSPILCALESEKAFYFVVPHNRHTLFDLVTHSPCAISKSTNKSLFIFYQLLQLLNECHNRGISFGEFGLHDIFIDDRLWISMVSPLSMLSHESFQAACVNADDTTVECPDTDAGNVGRIPLCDALYQWQNGALSNLDYLLCLNYHVGRKFGEPNNHPVVPWVTDFRLANGGYRDLTKSKHRLNKGDQQLDFTYVNAKDQLKANPYTDSVYPHHIGDLLSDVTYYMYRARQTPKELLCSRVRPRWVPGEYPSSIRKLYEWTPDECIPEFYTDPNIFHSIHDDLPDLAVPSWCTDAEQFVAYHRSMLESDFVSAHLHNWIDITFGYKLQGDAAVKAKNIHLSLIDGHTLIHSHGVVQLFSVAHPKRMTHTSAPYTLAHPLYNPFGVLQYGVVADGRDHMMSMEAPSKKEDTVQRIKRTMTRQELKEHLEQPGVTLDEQITTTPPLEFSDEHGFLDVSVHYPEIMSDKVSVSREGKSKEGLLPLSFWSSKPKASRVRQRKPGTEEAPIIEYPWQRANIQLPKDFVAAQNISRVEETGLFLYRALGDATATLQECWSMKDFFNHKTSSMQHGLFYVLEKKDKNFQLSFEEQVAVDTFSAICTVVEMCCADQLRAMMSRGASLLQRLTLLTKLHEKDVLKVPNFLHKLVSNYFTKTFSLTSTTSQGLPGISAPLILQQYIPVVCFPSHFYFLHVKLSELDYFFRELCYSQLNNDNFDSRFYNFLSSNVSVIVSSLDSESLQLFILHLMPYFTNSFTSFDGILTSFDVIAKYLNRDEIIRVFSPLLQDLYDQTSLSPEHKAQILHRPFLNTLIHHFGLAHFRERYISHVVEAVLNPTGVHSKKEHRKGQNLTLKDEQINLAKEEQQMATGETKEQLSLLLDIEPEYSSEEEGDDTITETYTSLLAQTPVQTSMPKEIPGASIREDRTYSICSVEDVISMEPIKVMSPTTNSEAVNDVKDNDIAHLLPYRSSPDITANSFTVNLAPGDVLSDQANMTSDLFISEQQSVLSDDMHENDDYKAKGDDDIERGDDGKDNDREESDDDNDGDVGSTELSQCDKMLAEVAADSLQWLMNRLGPLLATKYIIRPLLDGLYRCFTSHYNNQEEAVIKCLCHFVTTYGNLIVTKMYIPHAESLIEAAKRQMTHRSEGGLMASLAILQLCFEYMPLKTLEDNMDAYCNEIFHPITQFISSSSHVFTTGWRLRLRLCHLFIGTVSFVGKKLGREGALKFLSGVLQLFFTGFDVVYGVGLMHRDNTLLVNTATPNDAASCQVTVEDEEESVPLVSKSMLSATPSKLAQKLGSHLGDDTDSKENFASIQQLCKVFTPKLAHSAYVTMCLVLGQLNLRRELYNTELVEQITYSHDEAIQALTEFPQPMHFAPSCYSSDQSGYTSCDSGDECDLPNNLGPFININKGLSYDETDYGRSLWFVDQFNDKEKNVSSSHLVTLDEPDSSKFSLTDRASDPAVMLDMQRAAFETNFGPVTQELLTLNNKNSARKLKTMWAALWETRCQNFRSPYKFHNIKLQTYIGHKAAVKCMCVPDDELFFFSASKDRTVKIWSLHNRADDIEMYQCQRMYAEHQRSLLGVQYVENLQQVVSCDSGAVHLWDPETGYCLRQVTPTAQGITFTAMTIVPLAFQPLVVLGTSDSQLQILDARSKALAHKWKVMGLEPNGIVKCITCDDHMKWLAVGSNNDVIATLHPHTGEVLSSWKTAEFSTGVWKPYTYSYETDNILQLKATRRGLLISSNGNGIVSLWKPKAGNLVHHIKVGSSSIHCMEVYKDCLITVNSNNQVSIYRSYEIYNQTANPMQYKLQNKLLKGSVSSIAFLPNNQTMLMGSDSGQIALMA